MDQTAVLVAAIAAAGGILAALIAAAAAIIGLKNSGKLNTIHVLVNSNLARITAKLDQALAAEAAAHGELDRARAERAQAQAELAQLRAQSPLIGP